VLFTTGKNKAQEKKNADRPYNDKYAWDFGRVKKDQVVKHSFMLGNGSQKTITIKNINTSCGCTASKIDKTVLAPGETTKLEVQLKTKGYKGEVRQYVYVHTDNLDNPILRFIIKAYVEE
jgi:hypothetical protein